MAVGPFAEGLGESPLCVFDEMLQVLLRTWPLHQSEGCRSENWLRSGNWERDCDCLLGNYTQPTGNPPLISSAGTN